jgi:probable rRNA maturation factor
VSRSLLIQQRPGDTGVDIRQFRQAMRMLLQDLLKEDRFDLGIYIVRSEEMAGLNRKFLQHEGSTDVITFDYGDKPTEENSRFQNPGSKKIGASSRRLLRLRGRKQTVSPALHGEIFICVDDAIAQARRFRTTWTSELVRYAIHGVLHLLGHDDSRPDARRKMKREENRLVKEMARRFPLRKSEPRSRLAG